MKEPDDLAAKLPKWPRESEEADFVAILAYLCGNLANQPGKAFADAASLWEVLRHNEELRQLLDRLRPQMPEILKAKGVKTKEELFAVTDNLGAFSTPFGFIVYSKGFPGLPFTALSDEQRVELAECFAGGERAAEFADIRRLDRVGYIDWLRRKANKLAVEPFGTVKDAKRSWHLRPKLTEKEKVFDITLTVRGHHGIDAVKDQVCALLEEAKRQDESLFAQVDESLQFKNARDPRRILRDLAIARITFLLGFANALKWTSENRSAKTMRPVQGEWESYFGERREAKRGPLFRGRKEYWNRSIERGVAASRTFFNFT